MVLKLPLTPPMVKIVSCLSLNSVDEVVCLTLMVSPGLTVPLASVYIPPLILYSPPLLTLIKTSSLLIPETLISLLSTSVERFCSIFVSNLKLSGILSASSAFVLLTNALTRLPTVTNVVVFVLKSDEEVCRTCNANPLLMLASADCHTPFPILNSAPAVTETVAGALIPVMVTTLDSTNVEILTSLF